MGKPGKWVVGAPSYPSSTTGEKTLVGRKPAGDGPESDPKAIRVLILEDRPADAELVAGELLRAGLQVTWRLVSNEAGFCAALEDDPDVILADYSLPDFDALRALALVKQRNLDIPLIIVTGTLGDETAAECIKFGAADYILKDRPARLAEAVIGALEKGRLAREQLRVDQELTRSQRLKDAIVNAALDCIITVDGSGKVIDFNPAAERTFGYTCEEAIGKSMAELIIPPRFREAHQHGFSRLLTSGEGRLLGKQIELSALRKDGSEFPVELTITATGSWDTPLFTGHLRDISIRVAAEQALRESEARFRSFTENWPGRASIRDLEGRYKFVNAAWLQAFGMQEAQILGLLPEDVFSAERAAAVRSVHREVVERGSPQSRILESQSDLGTRTWLSHHFPVPDAAGNTRLVGTVAVDITEQLVQQDKIRRLNRIYTVLSGINSALNRAQDKIQLFQEACQIAVEHGNFGLAWIGLLDQATLDVTAVTWQGLGSEEMKSSTATARADLPQGQGVLGRAIRARRPVFDNDISATPGVGGKRRQEALRLGYRSLIVLPLFTEGDVVGVMALFAKEAGFFNEEEVKLLTELAANISFALEHMARRESVEKLQRVRAVTSEINTAIIRAESRASLFNEACRIAVESGGFGIAWIGALNAKTSDIQPVACAGLGAADFVAQLPSSARGDHRMGHGVAGRAVRDRSPAIDNNLRGQTPGDGTRAGEAVRRGYLSRIGLPLFVGREVFGVMVLYARERDFFTDEELKLLESVAGNISFALDNMTKQEKLEKLSRIRNVRSETNIAIARIHDRVGLLRETCRIAVEHGKFSLVWIASCDQRKREIKPIAWEGFSDEAARAVTWASIDSARGTMGEAVNSRRPAVRSDIEVELAMGALRKEALANGYYSTVCIPMFDGDSVIALLNLFAPARGFFDLEELSLLEELTSDISLALRALSRQEQVEYLSYYDALTSLPNRALFMDRAGQQLRGRAQEPVKVALILFNIERFRNVNESIGRPGGDQVLQAVSARLQSAFNGKDYLARVGGDNFGVIIRGLKDTEAAIYAVENHVLACFNEPIQLGEQSIHIAAKAGIAIYPTDGEDPDSLFRNAEAALKKARESGERYLFYAAQMNALASQVLSLETRLRRALEAQQFELHYQPKISLARGVLCGFEALIRWREPGKGIVPPGTFIPLMEETGLILPVGKWAIEQTLRDQQRLANQGRALPRIAVNVSAIQLQRREFPQMVLGILTEAGAKPDSLELEITESLLMKDIEASIQKLAVLRTAGVHIAMDDFGTGYSSLSYLARLPISSVKIDRTFVNGMATSARDMSIVTTIITLAHSLNLRVVAEGVETEQQAKLLALLKCDEAQGYHFSKPIPLDEIEPFLRGNSRISAH